MEEVICFTDGACRANGKKNAESGIGVYYPVCVERSLSERVPSDKKQSNIQAELFAILRCLENILEHWETFMMIPLKTKIIIWTDSKFSIDCITKWVPKWKKNDWIKSDGNEVLNKELLVQLDILVSCVSKIYDIDFKHVRGHQKEPADKESIEWFKWYGNDIADKLAKDSIDNINNA